MLVTIPHIAITYNLNRITQRPIFPLCFLGLREDFLFFFNIAMMMPIEL
jgi:hypothetical protein